MQAKIEAGHRWSGASALELTEQLLRILSYLHSIVPPVIHRDIKPANIVLRADGTPVLVDFGAVRDLGVSGNTTATVLGTPGYMAPEQALGRSNARSDLYGLGATLAHVFTHRHPHELLDASMRLDPRALDGLPERLRVMVVAMTEPDPTARPMNADALLELESKALALPSPSEEEDPSDDAIARLPSRDEHLPAPTGGRELPRTVKEAAMYATMRPERVKRRILPLLGIALATAMTAPFANPALVPFFPLIIFGAVAWFMGGGMRDAHRSRNAAKHGIETLGFVTAANAAQQGTFLEFTYEVDGKSYTGHGYTRDALAIARLKKGSPIAVYYDPDRPEISLGTLEAF